jgi:hypothetical protein
MKGLEGFAKKRYDVVILNIQEYLLHSLPNKDFPHMGRIYG